MSDMSTVTTSSSVSPISRPSWRSISATPPGSSRLSVSPCSSRSTIAWCSMRRRLSDPVAPVDAPCESLRNKVLDRVGDRRGRRVLRGGDRLDRLALRDHLQQRLVALAQVALVAHRPDQRLDDLRVEDGSAGRDLAHRAGELVALGDAVLEEVRVARGTVGEQRDRVLRVVELRQDDDAGARMALAQLLRRVDALALEVRRHPDVGHEHLRRRGFGAGDQLVVVGRGPDDREVGLQRQKGPHSLADDHVVVGEENGDRVRAVPLHVPH